MIYIARKREVRVKRQLGEEELGESISKEEDPRVQERLIFIKCIYDGDGVEEAADKVARAKSTGYDWLYRWNDGGLEGLKPDFGGGRPPKLPEEERQELKEILEERNDWTLKEISALIEEEYGIKYSRSHLPKVLKSMGMNCGKPYQKDYRRPENAEKILKDSLKQILEDESGFILGFLDESSPQTDSNTQRVWSFEKPEKKKNTTNYRANTFGFYSPNGKSVASFKENSKKESVCEFFERIREENQEEKIVIILDNFSSHRAKDAREKAEGLGIELVFLPPYSPDLNPIEQIWRGIKREISTAFFETKEEFLGLIENAFQKLSSKLSYARGWISEFLPSKFRKFQ